MVKQQGFTLTEVLIAMFLMGLGVLAAAPMFLFAMQANEVGSDIGSAGALAVDRLERLRSEQYDTLTAGGSIATNTVDFSDTSDPDFDIRWLIVDDSPISDTKTITVRVIPAGSLPGARRVVTLTTVRAP